MEWLKQFARLFGWKNTQFETLTEANAAGLKIRIWSTRPTLEEATCFDHDAFAQQIEQIANSYAYSREKLFRRLMAMPNVACVAIVNQGGQGVSVYPDWH